MKVLIGFVFGAALGLAVHFYMPDAPFVHGLIAYATKPFGQIFLNLLFMLVIPLMFSALVLGVGELGDIASLGRLGWKTLSYTAAVTGMVVAIGLLMVNLIRPGLHMDPALVQKAMASNAIKAGEIVSSGHQLNAVDLIVNIVPHNVIAAVIDAGHGNVYFHLIDSRAKQIFSPRIVTLRDAVRAIGGSAARIVGDAASLLAEEARRAGVEVDASGASAFPDIVAIARIGLAADPAVWPARPLYIKPPDAHPPRDEAIARADS